MHCLLANKLNICILAKKLNICIAFYPCFFQGYRLRIMQLYVYTEIEQLSNWMADIGSHISHCCCENLQINKGMSPLDFKEIKPVNSKGYQS